MKLTLSEVAKHVGGEVVGESDTTISGVSEIQNASPGTITFLGNPLYSKYLNNTRSTNEWLKNQSMLQSNNLMFSAVVTDHILQMICSCICCLICS